MNLFVDLWIYLCYLIFASPLNIAGGQRDGGYKYLHYGLKSVPENVKASATANKKGNINEISILIRPYLFKKDGKEPELKINDLLCAADCQLLRVINISTETKSFSPMTETTRLPGRPFTLSSLKDWCRENCMGKPTWQKAEAGQEEGKTILGKRQSPEMPVKEEPPEGYFAPAQIPKTIQMKPYNPVPGQVPVFPKHWKKLESFSSILPFPMSLFSSFRTLAPYPISEHPALRFHPGPSKHEALPDRKSADVGFRLWEGPQRRGFPVLAKRRKILRNYLLYHPRQRPNFLCTSCPGTKDSKYENEGKPVEKTSRNEKSEERETEEKDYEEIGSRESECEDDSGECTGKEVFLRLLRGILNLLSDKSFRAVLQKAYCNKEENSLPEEEEEEEAEAEEKGEKEEKEEKEEEGEKEEKEEEEKEEAEKEEAEEEKEKTMENNTILPPKGIN